MIKSLRLENFKGFLDLEVPEVAPITIIGGKNNVGKTSLLEGIFLFYDIGDPMMFVRHLPWRGASAFPIDFDTLAGMYEYVTSLGLAAQRHDWPFHDNAFGHLRDFLAQFLAEVQS